MEMNETQQKPRPQKRPSARKKQKQKKNGVIKEFIVAFSEATGPYIKRNLRNFDWYLFIPYIILCAVGLLMVYSASVWWSIVQYNNPPDYYYKRQLMYMILGFIGFVVTTMLSYRIYRTKIIVSIIAIGALLLLALVHTPLGWGRDTVGSQSWISLGFNLQPSEFAKLAVILVTSALITKVLQITPAFNLKWKHLALFFTYAGLCLSFVAFETDLGAMIVISGITLCILMISGVRFKQYALFTGGIFVGVGAFVLLANTFTDIFNSSRLGRFDAWFNPFDHARDSGYQIVQGYLAIGSGGLEGVGLGHSSQKLGFIPEPQTDFIMAIISEELGFIGVLVVVGFIYFIVCRAMLIALTSKDPFARMVAGGIGAWIGIQTFINLGGMVGFLPLTGVTLPFISYGGTSIILLSLAIGILMNISINEKIQRRKKRKGEVNT